MSDKNKQGFAQGKVKRLQGKGPSGKLFFL
jgi:hypothetical protein